MIIVTNEKVRGFIPRWAPFPGFSLLFDNPGDSLSHVDSTISKINCQVAETKVNLNGLELYRGLLTALEEINQTTLVNTYLFCPLPPYSYHVTVWDGLNVRNALNVSDKYRTDLFKYLDRIPTSLLSNSPFTMGLDNSFLLKAQKLNISFRFKELAKWNNDGLTALLEPASPESAQTLKTISKERQSLYEVFEKRFKAPLTSPYHPHISLGYFANRELAQLTTPLLSTWTDTFREIVSNLTITFNTVSLYGFTDMTTFLKKKQQR